MLNKNHAIRKKNNSAKFTINEYYLDANDDDEEDD